MNFTCVDFTRGVKLGIENSQGVFTGKRDDMQFLLLKVHLVVVLSINCVKSSVSSIFGEVYIIGKMWMWKCKTPASWTREDFLVIFTYQNLNKRRSVNCVWQVLFCVFSSRLNCFSHQTLFHTERSSNSSVQNIRI